MFDSAVGVNVGSVECARKQRQEHAENHEEVGPRALRAHRAQAGMHKPNIPQMLRARASTGKPEAAMGRFPNSTSGCEISSVQPDYSPAWIRGVIRPMLSTSAWCPMSMTSATLP